LKLDREFHIGSRAIGGDHAPYVIAEAGSNFNQDLDTAYRLIDVAADGGADCVKFQLFRADALYPSGTEMNRIFKSVELDPDWVPKLHAYARGRQIDFAASAFDRQSVDVLEQNGVSVHKIASSEATNLGLLGYIASRGKPVLLSTGMCDMVDVREAVNVCLSAGNNRVAVMQCVAMYPLPDELANLRVMDLYRDAFDCPVGFSDHTLGIVASIAAAAAGAHVVEKHFTLDKKSAGPDHFYALEPQELEQMIAGVRVAHAARGLPEKDLAPEERRLGRRDGLYAARRINAGEPIEAGAVAVRRPAVGIRARYLTTVVGARARATIEADAPIAWTDIDF
jgi:N,N'-diacetyllegionaminate synthase